MFEYKRAIKNIIDGDTLEASVDLGFHTYSRQRFRLVNYSAPEVHGQEKAFGIIAKSKLEELLPLESEVIFSSTKTEKFGRWLADVTYQGRSLSDLLVELGYGLPWNGRGTRPSFDLDRAYPIVPQR